MNIVVIGQGAIGLLWSTHLAQLNTVSLSVLHTGESSAKDELNRTASLSSFLGYSQSITLNPAGTAAIEQADVILVCVKAFHVAPTLTKIRHLVHDNTTIILCHNGLGTLEQAQQILPLNITILALLTSHGAFRPSRKHVVHTGIGQSDLGLIQGTIEPSLAKHITEQLNEALPLLTWHENIKEKQWIKLAINCVINPITAINNVPNGQINEANYDLQIASIANEVSKIAKCEGLDLSAKFIEETARTVAQNTAQNRSSMLCDIDRLQPTEIDFINGYISQLGKQYHIPTPCCDLLSKQVNTLNTRRK